MTKMACERPAGAPTAGGKAVPLRDRGRRAASALDADGQVLAFAAVQ